VEEKMTVKELIGILLESPFYPDLSLRERLAW
jgi:hypothetical protein